MYNGNCALNSSKSVKSTQNHVCNLFGFSLYFRLIVFVFFSFSFFFLFTPFLVRAFGLSNSVIVVVWICGPHFIKSFLSIIFHNLCDGKDEMNLFIMFGLERIVQSEELIEFTFTCAVE